jgi:hypothetical protein
MTWNFAAAQDTVEVVNLDALLDSIFAPDTLIQQTDTNTQKPPAVSSVFHIYQVLDEAEPVKIDENFLGANPLLIPLVYKEKQNDFTTENYLKYDLYLGKKPATIENTIWQNRIEIPAPEQIISNLRNNVYKHFILYNPEFFAYKQKQLPSTEGIKNRYIVVENWDSIRVRVHRHERRPSRIDVPKIIISNWTKKANIQMHFTQNMISDNWYQGGNSNMSMLGIFTAQMNYDNKKNIQFDNNIEWKYGFYSDMIKDSTIRANTRDINVNNDILKINSKFGFKMTGNWYYSASAEFSTQFDNNYKSTQKKDSTLKAAFLTPVRLNVNIGLDYKYKKLVSLAISPLAWKYIYVTDTVKVKDVKQFGIEQGKNHLSDIGSSFTATFAWTPVREIQVDSRLKFFTNYKKYEVDWEIVGNFTINRYLSTRLSINPRFDDTVILEKKTDKAKLQFKELLSFGISYKLLN